VKKLRKILWVLLPAIPSFIQLAGVEMFALA